MRQCGLFNLKTLMLCGLLLCTCRPFIVSAESKGLVEFEIPIKNQNKVFESLIEASVLSLSEKDIKSEDLRSFEKPLAIKIPRWMAGKIKRATGDMGATSEFRDVRLNRLMLGRPKTVCQTGSCILQVPLISFDFDFGYKLKTEENVTLFSGEKMGLRVGHAGYLNATSSDVLKRVQKYSFSELAKDAPVITIRFQLSGEGPLREQLRLTHPPAISFPERTMELRLQLSKNEQNRLDLIGRKAVTEKYPGKSNYSDQMIEAYVAEVGEELVREGFFKNRDSYGKFMLLKLMTEQFLMTSRSAIEFLENIVNLKVMPQVLQNTNRLLSQMHTLDERAMSIPLVDFQNIFDYTKNAEVTENIINRVRQGNYLSDKEWKKYFNRFDENWDYKSLSLIASLAISLRGSQFSDQKVFDSIETLKRDIVARIKEKEQKFTIYPELKMTPQGTRVVVSADKLGTGAISSEKKTPVEFQSSCDLVTHLAVDSINQWLKLEYKSNLLEGCIQTTGVELCSGNDKKFKGDFIEVVSLPSLEWDEYSGGYNLRIDGVRRDLRASSWGITSLLGLTKDAVSVRMGFKPDSCDNEFLCLKPTSQFTYLRMNNSTAFAGFVSLIKLVQLPYLVVGNALVLSGSSYLQNSVSEQRVEFPQFSVVEVKNTDERISICSKLK